MTNWLLLFMKRTINKVGVGKIFSHLKMILMALLLKQETFCSNFKLLETKNCNKTVSILLVYTCMQFIYHVNFAPFLPQ